MAYVYVTKLSAKIYIAQLFYFIQKQNCYDSYYVLKNQFSI